jgi:catechol 2,3-dioxygenase-like lactoylglutathione lyase family enzyme
MTGVQLTKDSIDLGIVVRNAEASLSFYRDLLGFEPVGEMPMPGGGTMYRLMCGTSLIKIVDPGKETASVTGGNITDAYGYRYFTISVKNLHDITDVCSSAGHKIVIAPIDIRPGITISIVEDPDGNLVEFLQVSQ